jgi:hypothetical protein
LDAGKLLAAASDKNAIAYVIENIDADHRKMFMNFLPLDTLKQLKAHGANHKIQLDAAINLHEKHNDSQWEQLPNVCKLKCNVCGIEKWNHSYECLASQGYEDWQDSRISFSEWKCSTCGHHVRLDWTGGSKQEGYILPSM